MRNVAQSTGSQSMLGGRRERDRMTGPGLLFGSSLHTFPTESNTSRRLPHSHGGGAAGATRPSGLDLDVCRRLRQPPSVDVPDSSLIADWDEFNIAHIARHGVSAEQVQEVYYGEGPLSTLGIRTRARWPSRPDESRYRLWETDASGEVP